MAEQTPREFQDSQIEVFLEENYTYGYASSIMSDLREDDFPDVMAATGQGLRSGLDDFLQEQGAETVYTADEYELLQDHGIALMIQHSIDDLGLDLMMTGSFSDDVQSGYVSFVLNESVALYNELFTPAQGAGE